MWGILGVFLQAAAGQILYLALHLESGSFPRPLSPAAERAAFAALRTGGAAGRDARDQLVRHNLRLVAHVCKKYYAATSNQDDLISIGTIGLIKAVDTLPARERALLQLRYGLGGEYPATQQQTADKLGISRSYVSRLEKRALTRLMNAWRR